MKEKGELRTERFMIDMPNVAHPRSLEIKSVDIILSKPAPVNLLDALLFHKFFE